MKKPFKFTVRHHYTNGTVLTDTTGVKLPDDLADKVYSILANAIVNSTIREQEAKHE